MVGIENVASPAISSALRQAAPQKDSRTYRRPVCSRAPSVCMVDDHHSFRYNHAIASGNRPAHTGDPSMFLMEVLRLAGALITAASLAGALAIFIGA